jgi:hypothetical protein
VVNKQKDTSDFPPVPEWRPSIVQPLERIIDRVIYYTDGARDFAVFENGTCAILPDGLSDEEVVTRATAILDEIIHYHPDMRPAPMDDGNILVQYNQPALNVVLRDVVEANWPEIEANHLRALARAEVLITPLGPNKFDAFGMASLFGRCYMFMDAQSPRIVRIVRRQVPSAGTTTPEAPAGG